MRGNPVTMTKNSGKAVSSGPKGQTVKSHTVVHSKPSPHQSQVTVRDTSGRNYVSHQNHGNSQKIQTASATTRESHTHLTTYNKGSAPQHDTSSTVTYKVSASETKK